MSLWEQERKIGTGISATTGELVLSASDVVAWLRDRANACALVPEYAHETAGLLRAADALADGWIDYSRETILGGA